MKTIQFRVLYREFLFRIVDLELLSQYAEGDSRTLLLARPRYAPLRPAANAR